MELILRDMEMQSLQDHLMKSKKYCESLASRFRQAPTSLEQTNLAFRWDAAQKHTYMVELLLSLMQRHERESRPPLGAQHIRLRAHTHRPPAADPQAAHEDSATATFSQALSF